MLYLYVILSVPCIWGSMGNLFEAIQIIMERTVLLQSQWLLTLLSHRYFRQSCSLITPHMFNLVPECVAFGWGRVTGISEIYPCTTLVVVNRISWEVAVVLAHGCHLVPVGFSLGGLAPSAFRLHCTMAARAGSNSWYVGLRSRILWAC